MKNILILVLIVFLALEGFSFWLVAQQTGWFVAIWFAIIISIIGFSLLKKSIKKLKAEAMSGIMPADDQFIFSAILLVIPGYFSDVLALVVLLPVVRRWMRNLLLLLVAKKYGFDPSLFAAMQNMGSQMGANGMGGMNMNDMASMFGHMDPNEFMKNMWRILSQIVLLVTITLVGLPQKMMKLLNAKNAKVVTALKLRMIKL